MLRSACRSNRPRSRPSSRSRSSSSPSATSCASSQSSNCAARRSNTNALHLSSSRARSKAFFKLHRRKSRLAKSKLRQRASLPNPPPSLASSSRTHSLLEDDKDPRQPSQPSRSPAALRAHDERQHLVDSRRSPARSSQSSSGDFSRTSSQAARLESPSTSSDDAAEEASPRRRRKRVSLRGRSSGPALERAS